MCPLQGGQVRNFTLSNAPAGVTVASVVHNSSTTATLTLDYDGTDFDANVTNFSITIAKQELKVSSDPLTSNTLTITAIVETAPTVTTDAAITTNGTTTATWGGEVTSDGGEPVTQKGLVWNTSSGPTTSNSKTEEGAGTGAITGNMTGLTPNTLYYLRAYATNSVGTAYGAERSFTTNNLSAPTANPATQISSTGFTANWSSVSGAESYRLDILSNLSLVNDDFEDGNFSSNPIWSGNIENYSVLTDVNIPLGTANTGAESDGFFLASNASIGHSALYLASTISDEWRFSLGSGEFDPSGSNYIGVVLMSDNTFVGDISSASFNGYYLRIGADGSTDPISFYRSTGTTKTSLGNFSSSPNFGTGALKNGLNIRVTRSEIGQFQLFYSTGFKYSELPTTSAGTITDNTHSNTSYFGIFTRFANPSTARRVYIDNIQLGAETFLSGFNDKSINSTSESVTGLTAGNTYYYRVRAYSTASTSSNSSTITVKTANNSQNTAVGGTGAQNIPVAGTTGIGNVNFTNVTTPGDLLISTFNNAPTNHGLTGNVSNYRWIIEPGSGLVFNQEDGYTLRFEVADCPGINILEDGNNTALQLYKRSTPGSGAFEGPIALTYRTNGTPQQSDDYLESALITSGFSEFVFGSESEPLPVEFATLTATSLQGSVKISWQTATEINNYGFEVERIPHNPPFGKGGIQGGWEKIGFVAGHGNSNSTKDYSFTDNNIPTSGKYAYRLKQIDTDGSFSYSQVVETDVTVNLTYSLGQNYPNPFNPTTRISYTIPETGLVTLKVYNLIGETVAELINQTQEAGKYEIEFNGSGLSNGVYFYELKANGFTSVKKLMLVK